MVTVKMFCDWDSDSTGLVEALRRQTLPFDEQIVEFVDGPVFDYAIAFNWSVDKIPGDFPHARTIGLILEPEEILDAMYGGWQHFDPSPYAGYYSFTPLVGYELASGVGFATAPVDYPYPSERPRRACMVCSTKTYTAAQRKRREVLDALLASGVDIDFYGRGMTPNGDPRVKGDIAPGQKHVVFCGYDMVIDFENDPLAVTDKFFDPIIAGCTPVSNVLMVVSNSRYFVSLDESTHEVVKKIRSAVDNGPLDTSHLYTEVTSGKLSLAHWINEKVKEIEDSSSRL